MPTLDGVWTITDRLLTTVIRLTDDDPPKYGRRTTMLEFGSGPSTEILLRTFTMHSIEHDPQFMQHEGTFIHPLKDGWYDLDEIVSKWDVWLIDGPPADKGDRSKVVSVLTEDNCPEWFVIDDTHRQDGQQTTAAIAKWLSDHGREVILTCHVCNDKPPRHDAVILRVKT